MAPLPARAASSALVRSSILRALSTDSGSVLVPWPWSAGGFEGDGAGPSPALLGDGGGGPGRGDQAGFGQVGRVGKPRGLAVDDPDTGAPVAAGGEFLDATVIERGARGDGVLGEDLRHVAPTGEGGGEDAFEHVRIDESSVSHGGIVIVVPASPPSETKTAAGHGPHAGLSAQLELTVSESDTAVHFRSGDVPVLATPRLIALCEEATCRATDSHLTRGAGQRGDPGPVRPPGSGGRRFGGAGRGDPGQGGGPAPDVHRLGGPARG